MPIEYRYDPEENVLYEKGIGKITFQEFLDYRKALMNEPLQPKFRALADYLEAEINFNFEEMQMVGEMSRRIAARLKGVRLAICSGSTLGFGMARMFSALAEKEEFRVRAFKSKREAREWLELDK